MLADGGMAPFGRASFVRMTEQQEYWIPAYAGMTETVETLDPRIREDDRNYRNTEMSIGKYFSFAKNTFHCTMREIQ